jgi:hypothetical protein
MNELETILNDFCSDIKNTFPEKKDIIDGYNLEQLVSYCNNYYTERTLEIVYKNEKIFATSCFLLPDIDFSQLWNSNISTETKETIWKYLQLILFSYVSLDAYSFDDTVKFFEQLDKDEFKEKIDGIMKNLKSDNNFDTSIMPNEEKLNNSFDNLFDSKIGSLASEIAKETSKKMNIDESQDIMSNLLNNPAGLMSLVKNVGECLDERMKSGEIKQEELLKESTSLLGNFNMNTQMKNLFSSLGLGDLTKMAEEASETLQNNQQNTDTCCSGGSCSTDLKAPTNKNHNYDTNRTKQKFSKLDTKERLRRKLERKKREEEKREEEKREEAK